MKAPRAYGPGEVDRLPPAPAHRGRKPAHRDAPVLRRPFRAKWQLQASVWVCLADLRALVLPAREAMATHDPYSQVDADHVDRTYVRCTREVWRALSTRRAAAAIEHVRLALASVYTLDGLAPAAAPAFSTVAV